MSSAFTIRRCQTKAGLISSARMYKLICKDDALFILHLGRAGTLSKTIGGNLDNDIGSALGKYAAKKLLNKYDQKAAEAEESLNQIADLDSIIDGKNHFKITKSDISELKIEHKRDFLGLTIKSAVKNFVFYMNIVEQEKLDKIVSLLA